MLLRNTRLRKERLLYENKRKIREALQEGKPIPTDDLRNIRLRREYLYRKRLEGKERLLYENKRKISEALQEGKPIPTELRNEEAELRREIYLEDENTAVPRTHIDDEYAKAAERDPKILITTSRNPSAPLVQFAKELKLVFPNAQQMNRGGQVISEIIETCRAHDFIDVVLVHENCGVPDGLFIIHLPFGPTAFFELRNVVTRHDIKDKKAMGMMPQVYPHVILDNFTTKLGERTANILKHLSSAKARYEAHNHFRQSVRLYFIQASYLWEAWRS